MGIQEEISESQRQLQVIDAIEADYHQEAYTKAYEQALQLIEEVELFRLNTPNLEETQQLWQRLSVLNLPVEQTGKETSAWLFLYRWLTALFPLVIGISATFLLTLIFSFSYHEKVNYDRLVPIHQNNQKRIQLLWSFFLLVGGFVGILRLVFLVSGLVGDFGSRYYPIVVYGESGMSMQPVGEILQQSLILIALSIGALTATSLLFMRLLKNQVVAFFLMVFFYLGQAYLPDTLHSFKDWLHLLPGYYLRSTEVVIGNLALAIENPLVTVSQGVQVISFYTMGVLFVLFLEDVKRRG